MRIYFLCIVSFLCLSCSGKQEVQEPDSQVKPADAVPSPADGLVGAIDSMPGPEGSLADVVSVSVSGEAGSYTFSVQLKTGDTGCEHYADWWEVVDSSGLLVYRRILGHSHVEEQPFTRSGRPVAVDANEEFTVRAHMNDTGYGGLVLQGTVEEVQSTSIPKPDSLGEGLSEAEPQPQGCAF